MTVVSPAGGKAAEQAQIAALSNEELIARYRRGLESFDRRIFELSDEQMDQAFLPDAGVGRWPVRVLVGHLADAELAFTHRMRRAVAEESPVLAVWDENAFIDTGMYAGGQYPLGGFVAVIHTLRRWTAEWLGTLSPPQLERKAMHPERGPESVRLMLVYTTWHIEHHARYLNAKVCRLLGPAPAERAEGGCGAGCGCHKKS
jgi:DinB superfamily